MNVDVLMITLLLQQPPCRGSVYAMMDVMVMWVLMRVCLGCVVVVGSEGAFYMFSTLLSLFS